MINELLNIVLRKLVFKKRKPNLVLIGGFGSTSENLGDAISFFEDFFVVKFINLPGMIQKQTLPKYSMDTIVKHVQKQIDALNIKRYILGSLSFGFAVCNQLKLNEHCKGILVMEPYADSTYLKVPTYKKIFLRGLFWTIVKLNLVNFIWNTKLIEFGIRNQGAPDIFLTAIRQAQPRAFFEYGNVLVKFKSNKKFHNLPHVVVANEQDPIADSAQLLKDLREKVDDVLYVPTKYQHFPEKFDKAFLKKLIDKKALEKMIPFFREKCGI